ncbi:2'-5' RNA ligase family protein [Ferroplasma acidiphilum]|uniref:2'-5' RNA ligase family protein n=2 Tax=Ferroplasma acidiphilum TaxID=74969 RepID=A0A7K4FNP3_9ARCH|nr:2'-5' RNA ligase family protein [Ferroplasma acidiphilum]
MNKMQYTLILKPSLSARRKITAKKKRLEKLYGYTGSLSNKGVHITMAYLRNSRFLDVNPIITLCGKTAPFTYEMGEVGYFEKVRKGKISYIVFLNVIPSPEMYEFHEGLIKALGDNTTEVGKFIPHITLIRKNVNENNLNEIVKFCENLKIDCKFLSTYLILGKRSSEYSRWHFEHIDFHKI